MAAIIRRSSGRYSVRVRVTGNPSIHKTFTSKQSAAAWASQTEDAIRRGVYEFGKADIPTLGQALKKYAKLVTPKKRGARNERYVLAVLSRLAIANKPLDLIQPAEIVKLRDAWAKEVSPSTIQKRHALLSHVYNTAVKEWGYDLVNPLDRVSKLKIENQRTRVIEQDELEVILANATNATLKAVAWLAWLSAARAGELAALQWPDVDIDASVMTFPLTKNGSARTVPLVPAAVALLESLKPKTHTPLVGPVFGVTSDALTKAWARSVKNARAAYERSCEQQGVEPEDDWLVNAHFHDLRHSAITRFAQRGLSTLKLAAISGHKSVQMLSRYSHISAHKLAQELAALEQGATL